MTTSYETRGQKSSKMAKIWQKMKQMGFCFSRKMALNFSFFAKNQNARKMETIVLTQNIRTSNSSVGQEF